MRNLSLTAPLCEETRSGLRFVLVGCALLIGSVLVWQGIRTSRPSRPRYELLGRDFRYRCTRLSGGLGMRAGLGSDCRRNWRESIVFRKASDEDASAGSPPVWRPLSHSDAQRQ